MRHRNEDLQIQIGALELTKRGVRRYDIRDPYHLAVTLTWPVFFLTAALAEMSVNLIFATLYWLQPGSIENAPRHSFLSAFFFSVETLATVGYGVMSPGTLYAHIISTMEIFCGLLLTAIMTGLLFVRFSRPKTKILYADRAVVTRYNGVPTLMLRVANGRATVFTHAHAELTALFLETTEEGHVYRRLSDLQLIRQDLAIFAVTWTLMHKLDKNSPLFGYSAEQLVKEDVRLFLAVSAQDAALGASIKSMQDYGPEQIIFGKRFADALQTDDQGRTLADITQLSTLEDDFTSAPAAPAMP